MRNLLICVLLMSLSIQIIQAQQTPAPFVTEVYDDIYQVMHTRQSPEKPNLVLSDNTREIALFSPSINQIAIGQDFIDLARSFGEDSMNVIAQIMSHELAHVLLEQSTIIKNIGSGYASKEFNKRLRKTNASLRDSLYERQADEYSFFYAQIAGYQTSDIAPRILDSIYKQWNLKNSDLKRYPPLAERKLIATTATKKMKILKELFDVGILSAISGQYNLAIDLFKFILEEDFDSREIHNNLGTAYLMKAISNLDTLEYPYVFPVQMDLNTKLENERGFDIGVENDLKKALEQFKFACEGKEKYPIAMLNKAICEWLLEDEEYEISMMRISKLDNDIIRQNASILRAIDFYHKEDEKSCKSLLKELQSDNDLADLNYNILFKKCKRQNNETIDIPSLDLPDFDFLMDYEARKSDTLVKVFGSNARDYHLWKLSNENWKGYRIRVYEGRTSAMLTLYQTSNIPESFRELEDLKANFETSKYKFKLQNNTILKFDRDDNLETIYQLN
ncbi:hypothetical protein OAL39_00520 [bacterium]|nr:hypothetical protein [bacterium]